MDFNILNSIRDVEHVFYAIAVILFSEQREGESRFEICETVRLILGDVGLLLIPLEDYRKA